MENKSLKEEFRCRVTLDCVIFGFSNASIYVLLTKRLKGPYKGEWSLVGSDLSEDEDLSKNCTRIIKEVTGLKDVQVYQSKTFGKQDRHPLGRVITCTYFAPVRINEVRFSSEEERKWLPVREVEKLAFDHEEIIRVAFDRLKEQLQVEPICFDLLPLKFTLNELQQLYECAFNIEMDKANFRKKVKSLPLKDLKEKQVNVKHRPASLFEFDLKKYKTMNKNGQFNFRIH